MDTQTLVFDGKNLVARNFFAYPKWLANEGGSKTSMLHGSFLELFRRVKEFKPKKTIVTWDSKSVFRRAIHPTYKAVNTETRFSKSDYENFSEQLRMFEAGLQALGVLQLKGEGIEGDDLVAYAALETRHRPATVVSTDHDFWQLIRPTIQIYDARLKRTITSSTFQKESGFDDPMHHLAFKLIKGDSGDGVPPAILRIGDEKAKVLARELELPTDLLEIDRLDRIEGPVGYQTKEVEEALARNFKLVSLHAAIFIQRRDLVTLPLETARGTWKGFLTYCQEYQLATVMKAFTEVQSLF